MYNNQGMPKDMNAKPRAALDNMKFEIARELGVDLKQGDNGHLTSKENGSVGGYMVKRLVEQAEQQMANKQ